MNKPRMLIVIPNMHMGGAQTALLSFLRTPLLQRFQVTVSIAVRGGVLEEFVPEDVRVVHGFDYFALDRYSGSLISALFAALRRLDFQQAFGYLRRVAYFSILRGVHPEEVIWRLVRKRTPENVEAFDVCIAFMQGTTSYYVIDKLPNVHTKILEFNTDFEKAGYSPRYNRRFFQSADAVVCVSEIGTLQLQKLFPEVVDKIHHIPYALEGFSIPDPVSDGIALEAASFDGLRLVSVGRLEIPGKGYDLLIETARILRDSGVNFRWWFVGDGGSRERIEREVRSLGLDGCVVLTGTILDPFSVMRQADVFVHGSRFEGTTPRAVREAMSVGLPVVTTDYAAAVSELVDGRDCLIVAMDANAIAGAIQRLIAEPDLRRTLGANGSKIQNVSAMDYHDLLNRHLGEAAPDPRG